MALDLKPTRVEQEYEVGDEGGYRWHVIASFDPEYGWTASVTMVARGLRTAEAAIEFLRTPVARFLDAMGSVAPVSLPRSSSPGSR